MKTKNKLSIVVIVAFLLFYLTPFIATAIYSLSTEWDKNILPKGMTVQWFAELAADPKFFQAVFRSILLALIVLIVILLIMIPSVIIVLLYHPKIDNYMQGMSLMPYAIPGVILVTALLKTYSKTGVSMLLVLGGALFVTSLPVMYMGIRNSLIAIRTKELMEAGMTLGASPFTIGLKVILPNIRIGVVLSSLMTFSGLFGEYVLTNLLIGGRFETLRIYMLRRMHENGHLASAVMVFYFVCIALMGVFINYLSHRQKKRLAGKAPESDRVKQSVTKPVYMQEEAVEEGI